MELQELTKNGVTIVELRGRLDEIAAAKAERRFRELLAEGARRVVVDMSEVDYVNSNGLRALLVLHQGLEQPGAGMCLCGVTSFVAEIIAISKLDEYLQIQPDRVSALAALAFARGLRPTSFQGIAIPSGDRALSFQPKRAAPAPMGIPKSYARPALC